VITSAFAGIRSMPRNARLSILAVAGGVLVMLWLLYRTESNAAQVGRETRSIAASGRGINSYTDSIAQLSTTNRLAASVLASVTQVETNLAGIARAAGGIDVNSTSIQSSTASIAGSAHSIDVNQRAITASVATIGGNVGRINAALSGVNGNAGRIVTSSLSIQRGVALISSDLATTRSVTNRILADVTDVDAAVGVTNHEAACIDNGLNGGPRC
jgi:hypothetical protein